MTIEKITIKVSRETDNKIYNVEISIDNLIQAIQMAKSTELLWLYIDGWIKGEEDFQAEK